MMGSPNNQSLYENHSIYYLRVKEYSPNGKYVCRLDKLKELVQEYQYKLHNLNLMCILKFFIHLSLHSLHEDK